MDEWTMYELMNWWTINTCNMDGGIMDNIWTNGLMDRRIMVMYGVWTNG